MSLFFLFLLYQYLFSCNFLYVYFLFVIDTFSLIIFHQVFLLRAIFMQFLLSFFSVIDLSRLPSTQSKFRKMVEDNKQLASRIDGDLQTAHQEVSLLRQELADTNRRITELTGLTQDPQDGPDSPDAATTPVNGSSEFNFRLFFLYSLVLSPFLLLMLPFSSSFISFSALFFLLISYSTVLSSIFVPLFLLIFFSFFSFLLFHFLSTLFFLLISYFSVLSPISSFSFCLVYMELFTR